MFKLMLLSVIYIVDHKQKLANLLKRLFDISFAVLTLILLSPVLLATSLWIKISSKGEIFFRQERIGKSGIPFKIYKFRTMITQAEQADNFITVTARNDPRLIKGGAFLRKFKIDELPQIINILNGSMSLVGPRPTVKEDIDRMDQRQQERLKVFPGLTGLAQINGNTSLSWPERIEYDLDYVARQSFFLDLKILAVTFWQVILGKADTHPQGKDEWVNS